MSDLEQAPPPAPRYIESIPLAMSRREELGARLSGRELAIFLDYDGTLTPIVDDPDLAVLSEETRETLRRLSRRFPVAVLSGRDLPDVAERVGLEEVCYAGSHGFDIRLPDGRRWERAEPYLPSLATACRELEERLDPLEGVLVERKRYAVAVHYRRAPEEAALRVLETVDTVAGQHDDLRLTGGTKIRELRPDVDWDKGRALEKLLGMVDAGEKGVLPIYVGDDVTDEDAFRAIAGRGLGVVVRGENDARRTLADLSLSDTGAVRRFLDLLVTLGEATDAG